MFKSADKFYDLMLLTKGEENLTEEEIEFGRDNLSQMSLDFKQFISIKIARIDNILCDNKLSSEDREKMLKTKEKLQKY